jgi:hypothetical protein
MQTWSLVLRDCCQNIAHAVHELGLECDGVDAVGVKTFANAFSLRHEIRQGGVICYDVR